MKLSISNIGWSAEYDAEMYEIMTANGFQGLEIAPTRIFQNNPYERIYEAKEWLKNLRSQYGFVVPSIQSILFGRNERIFGSKEEFKTIVNYTKKAIDFASAIECRNLVFGCPRNRNIPEGQDYLDGVDFFKEIGDYAAENKTVIGIEANPVIYNTNYINDTESALMLIEQVDSDGFKLNLDVGTIIYNNEDIDFLKGKVNLINHVHISEPGLKPIECKSIHTKLKDILITEDYSGFISIEMGRTDNIKTIKDAMQYVRGVFE